FVQTHKGWRRNTAISTVASVPDQASSLVTSNDPLAETPARSSFFFEFKAGLRYMTSHKFILGFIVLGILFNILATPAALLTPLQVTRDFGADAWRLGAIEVVFSVGMMLGGLLMGIWGGFKNRTYTMALSTLFFGLGTIGLGIMGDFWLYLTCIAFVGIIMPLFNAPMMGILQEKIDPDYMGRVFSVFMMFGSLSMPVGMLVFGPLADAFPIDWLLIITGAGVALLSLYLVASRHLREAGKVTPLPDDCID
ncbi:MAG: MFS transporter, partial [Candidatus Cloacimonetes bacterium]|nr:MFS transporter [Candidatus Cloacimonadota bacterium]